MYINLANFSGIFPRIGPTALAPNQAQIANNVKLQSGELRSWRKPTVAYTPANNDVLSIYKLVAGAGNPAVWLEWPYDVDVVPGPVADTTDYRLYFTSASFGPRKTNYAMATSGGAAPYPNTYYEMGVPAPTGAPTLSASGGTAPTETRAYIYTYVTQFGSVLEESAPSPAATVTCNSSGSTVLVSGFSSPPAGSYNFIAKRIYRSVTGANTASYQLVAQIPIAQATYNDSLSVTALGQVLPSLYYTPPPSTLQGIVAMPNGILAGFTGNQVWFCEPYLPHAWPSTYMLTTEFPIVGLGVFGSTLFVGTTKNPYLITGTTPSAMSQEKLPIPQPCVSKRSIVSDQYGVIYASPNGLVSIGSGTQEIVTSALFTRDEWQAINPSSILGIVYNNMYIANYESSGTRNSMIILRGDNPPLLDLVIDAQAIFVEQATSDVFYVSHADNKIYKLEGDTVNNTVFEWKSKKFIMPHPTNFGAMKLQADYDYMNSTTAYNAARAAVVASNQSIYATNIINGALNTSTLNTYSVNGSRLANIPTQADVRYITVAIYADGVPVYTTAINSQDPMRLPAGFKAYVWEVYLSGNTPVREFHMAATMDELKQLPNG